MTNVLSAGLTVASAAIADAGIPMFALGVGTTLSRGDDQSLVDPESNPEQAARIVVGALPAIGKISGVWLSGEVDLDSACEVSIDWVLVLTRQMIAKASADAKITHGVLAQALVDGAQERLPIVA